MIGPPFWKLSMKKFLLSGAGAVDGWTGLVLAAGAIVAETELPTAGAVPGAGGTAGAVVVPGATAAGAPGVVSVVAAEAAGDAAASAGLVIPGLVAGEGTGS